MLHLFREGLYKAGAASRMRQCDSVHLVPYLRSEGGLDDAQRTTCQLRVTLKMAAAQANQPLEYASSPVRFGAECRYARCKPALRSAVRAYGQERVRRDGSATVSG